MAMYITDEVCPSFFDDFNRWVMQSYIVHHQLCTFVIQDGHYKEDASGELFHDFVVGNEISNNSD